LDSRSSPRQLTSLEASRPFFGADGDVYFLGKEGSPSTSNAREKEVRPMRESSRTDRLFDRRLARWSMAGRLDRLRRRREYPSARGLSNAWRPEATHLQRVCDQWSLQSRRADGELDARSPVHVLQIHPRRHGSQDDRDASAIWRGAAGLAALRVTVSSRCVGRAWSLGHRGRGCVSRLIVVGLCVYPKDDTTQSLQHSCSVRPLTYVRPRRKVDDVTSGSPWWYGAEHRAIDSVCSG